MNLCGSKLATLRANVLTNKNTKRSVKFCYLCASVNDFTSGSKFLMACDRQMTFGNHTIFSWLPCVFFQGIPVSKGIFRVIDFEVLIYPVAPSGEALEGIIF